MKKVTSLLYVIGVIQITLGVCHLSFPEFFLKSKGYTIPQTDIFYPLAMFVAKFIAYGTALIYIASDPIKHSLWMPKKCALA